MTDSGHDEAVDRAKRRAERTLSGEPNLVYPETPIADSHARDVLMLIARLSELEAENERLRQTQHVDDDPLWRGVRGDW